MRLRVSDWTVTGEETWGDKSSGGVYSSNTTRAHCPAHYLNELCLCYELRVLGLGL